MNKTAIILAAGLVTYSVGDGAHARCNTHPDFAGRGGLSKNVPNPGTVYRSPTSGKTRQTNRDANDGFEDLQLLDSNGDGVVICQDTQRPYVDPTPSQNVPLAPSQTKVILFAP